MLLTSLAEAFDSLRDFHRIVRKWVIYKVLGKSNSVEKVVWASKICRADKLNKITIGSYGLWARNLIRAKVSLGRFYLKRASSQCPQDNS